MLGSLDILVIFYRFLTIWATSKVPILPFDFIPPLRNNLNPDVRKEEIIILKDLTGQTSVEVTLNAPTFMELKGMSYSEIEKTNIEVDSYYDPFYSNIYLKKGTELKHRHLIRSAVVRISSAVHDPFKIYEEAIRVKFK